MAQTQEDPFAKYRVNRGTSTETPRTDPFEQYRVGKIEESETKQTKPEEIPQPEEESIWQWLTDSILPEGLPSGDEPTDYWSGFAKGATDYGYEELVRPIGSPLGAALTVAGGPLVRGVVKGASMIPGVSKIGSLLNKKILPGEAPEFIKKTVKSLTPKGSKATTPIVADDVPTSPEAFEIEAYRGTKPGETLKSGQFYSADENIAKAYGDVSKEKLKFINPLKAENWVEAKKALGLEQSATMDDLLGAANKAGHDGIVFNNHNGAQEFVKLAKQAPQLKPVDKLLEAIKTAKPLEEKQASIYTKEKAAKMTDVRKVRTEGLQGHIERKSKLAGEHTKVVNEPLQLEGNDVDSLFNEIKLALRDEFQAIHAGDGLQKILAGSVPQKSELALLERVFGPEISKLPANGTKVHLARLGADVSRAMNTIHDLSMPFRQGLGAISDKSWWNSWVPMVKAFGNQEAADGAWQSVMKHEFAQPKVVGDKVIDPLYKRIGLALIDPDNTASLGEARGSHIVEKYIPGAKASNRAAATFLNKIRTDMTNRLLYQLRSAGYDIEGADIDFSRKVANFVNNATGRGANKHLEKYSNFMNDMLFSPRLQYSRFHMLNPKNYLTATSPEGRLMMKQYWKAAAGIGGAWLTGLKLLEQGAGFDVNWTDPASSNFLKATKGDISVDPGGSFGQILTLMYRLGSGGYKTLSGKEKGYGFGFGTNTMKDAIEDFVTNKLAPVPKFMFDSLNAQEKFPVNLTDRTIRLVVPLIYQDLSEIAQEDPNLMWLLGPAATGVGVSNYESKDLFGESDIIPNLELPVKRGR